MRPLHPLYLLMLQGLLRLLLRLLLLLPLSLSRLGAYAGWCECSSTCHAS
jgi:hypothetical protein